MFQQQLEKKERFNFRKLNILDQCTEQYRTTTTPPISPSTTITTITVNLINLSGFCNVEICKEQNEN
ncbi:hypothetical protein DERP_003557 [Dermatophagoides pteronyssinus]|uniref:Uncharacterized protein n=1 Tax=Dermatophagoides pteronyssinus TaxID=6956 RepID=A0ABQ8JKY5_DERPT|nr:hypothetical protein DERP_003557 [Dermatophagoides pteronyssinus]